MSLTNAIFFVEIAMMKRIKKLELELFLPQ